MAEKLTFNQISEQYSNDPATEPTVLLERSSGMIQTARLTPKTDEYGRCFVAFTDVESGRSVGKLKPMSNEALSDDRQAVLAESLAETLVHNDIVERPRDIPTEVVHEAGEAALELAGIAEPQPETEAEMYERFSQETRLELQQLYKEHREAQPGSDEMYRLERQIKDAKEDAGKYARLAARARGNTNWL